MRRAEKNWSWNLQINFQMGMPILAITMLFLLIILALPSAQAQTYTVVHNFTGGGDGAAPEAGLTMDAAGNLYGTATGGGSTGGGTVFKLRHSGSSWVMNTLYSFQGGYDGSYPFGRVAIAKDGTLYGTTFGGNGSAGTVFHLTPSPTAPKTALAPWNETILYRFTGGIDGAAPEGDLTFDQAGSIYGTAAGGGPCDNEGVVYKLTSSGGGWTETVLYAPCYLPGPAGVPLGGVIFDTSGNLDGVLRFDGYSEGSVYQLSPSGSGWTEQTLYGFTGGNDGGNPEGGLILDSSGNLYGTTPSGGGGGGGTVWELTPFNGGWTFHTLYGLSGQGGSWGKLLMDATGNLYGTAAGDGAYGQGAVFKLTLSGGVWTYTSLHDFTGGSDGGNPFSNLVFDANGNLYGTTFAGGVYSYGVVFEITP